MSKLVTYTTQRVTPNINYGGYLKIIYQYYLINCNKYTILMQDINDGGLYTLEAGASYMGTLYLQLNFSVNLSLLLKIKLIITKQNKKIN